MKIIVAPIPVPSQIAPGLPLQFDRWWAKASNREPDQRYQSAKELADGLSLVFGQSQLTDVIDRSELNAAMGAARGGAVQANTPGYGMGTPNPVSRAALTMATPHPYTTPQPYPGTPQPYGQQGTPQPFHGTPQPQMGAMPPGTPQPYAPGPHASTGAPIARTFGDAAAPQKKTGMIVGIAAGAVLLIAMAGVGISVKSKGSAASGGAPTASAPVATATATMAATTTASAPSAVALAPPPAPSDSCTPAATDSSRCSLERGAGQTGSGWWRWWWWWGGRRRRRPRNRRRQRRRRQAPACETSPLEEQGRRSSGSETDDAERGLVYLTK